MTTELTIVGQADTSREEQAVPKSTLETIPVPEYDPNKKLPKGYVSPFACLEGRAVQKNRRYILKNRWPDAHFTPSFHDSLGEAIHQSSFVGDYVICGDALVMKRGMLAPRGSIIIPETEKEYQDRILRECIEAEKEAIFDALQKNLDSRVYEALREKSGLEVKLTFTVSVDRTKRAVKSVVSGSIPIKSSASTEYEDTDQMELDL